MIQGDYQGYLRNKKDLYKFPKKIEKNLKRRKIFKDGTFAIFMDFSLMIWINLIIFTLKN